MPQMSPMNWVFLMIFNLINFLFLMLYLYYMVYKNYIFFFEKGYVVYLKFNFIW